MEWVETTGPTVVAALEAALDTLGVHEDDLEYEVIAEPRGGLLGRREARIRARVRPISREKPERDSRRPRRAGSGRRQASGGSGGEQGSTRRRRAATPSGSRTRGPSEAAKGASDGRAARRPRRRPPATRQDREDAGQSGEEVVSDVPVEEQAGVARDFTRGLVEAFGANAEVSVEVDEEGGVLVDVTGRDLGLLVGPKGSTVQAIEELVRTIVQRQTEGHGTRINVDVAGYRAKRREALTRFVAELATKVRETGREQALEPMSAADRKVVHDAIAPMEGVATASEGEEPRRRVVVHPA